MDKNELQKKDVSSIAKSSNEDCDRGVYLKFDHKFDEKTGSNVVSELTLSDGTKLENTNKETIEKFAAAFKRTTGSQNFDYGIEILGAIAAGMEQSSHKDRLNYASIMLAALNPQDEMESLLLGQFLTLQRSGMKCLRQANQQEMFYHEERLFMLASKLFAQANSTMQSLMKYRSKGQQTVQIVHIHDKGQAVIAQTLNPS